MDRARHADYIGQLPRATLDDVYTQEQHEDNQRLLHEPWTHFCDRAPGCREDVRGEERNKWVTEDWEEYEARVPKREARIDTFFNKQAQQQKQEADQNAARDEKARSVIAMINAKEKNRLAQRLPTLHTLLPGAGGSDVVDAEIAKQHQQYILEQQRLHELQNPKPVPEEEEVIEEEIEAAEEGGEGVEGEEVEEEVDAEAQEPREEEEANVEDDAA